LKAQDLLKAPKPAQILDQAFDLPGDERITRLFEGEHLQVHPQMRAPLVTDFLEPSRNFLTRNVALGRTVEPERANDVAVLGELAPGGLTPGHEMRIRGQHYGLIRRHPLAVFSKEAKKLDDVPPVLRHLLRAQLGITTGNVSADLFTHVPAVEGRMMTRAAP